MIVESVELKDYRNYEFLDMNFNEHVNIIYGDNAQGKTNILESIYMCSTSKSHRGSKDREIVRFGEDESHIKLNVLKHGMKYRIDMHLKKNKTKGIAVNGIPIKKAVELFGIINIVFFSPEDLNIIKNGPSERRRFMDMELSQLLYIHIEKADRDYPGAYQMLCRQFCTAYADGLAYVNREEDMGDLGLRKAKRDLHPVTQLKKYTVEVW